MMDMSTKVLRLAVAALAAMPVAADAQSRYGYYNQTGYDARYDNRRYDNRRYDSRRYDTRRYDTQRGYDAQRYYDGRGYAGRYDTRRYANDHDRRCSSGTTGTIIGAALGGLLGREIAGRGDRTVGTIVGGAAGALGGRAIDRNCRR